MPMGPWGRVAGRTGRTANRFTYNGLAGVMDGGNGLYFMRARYYSPMLMRFVQRDPVFEGNLSAPQSLNRYAFALGNPIQFTDPDGESVTLTVILIGAALGVSGEIAWDVAFNELDPFGGWDDAWAPYLEDNWVDLTVAGVLGAVTGPGAKIVQSLSRAKKLTNKVKRLKKSYDALNHITSVTYDNDKSVEYTYDVAGNVLRVEVTTP